MMEQSIRGVFQVFSRRFGFLNKNCCQAGGHDITLVQSHILYEISHQHSPSIQQVADALGTDITTFSRQVQSLIKMNLVMKKPYDRDRRISILSLTDEGEDVAASIDREMNDYLEEIFSQMSPDEKDMVLQSIRLLNEHMGKAKRCCTTLL